MILTDSVITLKPFKIEDAERHLAGEDAAQQKWLSGGKSTLESVRKWIKLSEEYWQKGGPVFAFAVWANGELVGMIEANTDEKQIEGLQPGDANISYGLYPQARGKGYATRAVNLLIGFLKERALKRAVIRVDPKNVLSSKLPLRCGFNESGTITTREGGMLIMFVKDL